MKLILLDDDANFNAVFCGITAGIDGYDAEIAAFCTEDAFAEYIRNNYTDISAVIMDIELKNSNGIELASAINHAYQSIPIIFITGYPEKYCQEVFLKDIDLTPLAFITKPVTESSVSKVLKKLSRNSKKTGSILLKDGKTNIIVNTDDILYIESKDKYLIVNTVNETYTLHGKLSDLSGRLPGNFLVPHKSYIVNIKYIKEFTRDDIKLTNDKIIPISRSRKTEFIDRLIFLRGGGYDT